MVHAGTAAQSASPPFSLSGPIAHDFQLERTIVWSHACADVVATITATASVASCIVFPSSLKLNERGRERKPHRRARLNHSLFDFRMGRRHGGAGHQTAARSGTTLLSASAAPPRPCQPFRVVRAKRLGGIAKTREECRSLAWEWARFHAALRRGRGSRERSPACRLAGLSTPCRAYHRHRGRE